MFLSISSVQNHWELITKVLMNVQLDLKGINWNMRCSFNSPFVNHLFEQWLILSFNHSLGKPIERTKHSLQMSNQEFLKCFQNFSIKY